MHVTLSAMSGEVARFDASRMRAWAECPSAALRDVCGVFTDIDDTLTRDGAIEAQALAALNRLAAAGVPVVAITGRPLGWSQPFAAVWPVAAIVAENGAVALVRQGHLCLTEFVQNPAVREANALRLQQVAARVPRDVPGSTLAQDSAGRATDIAIDHSEFAHLGQAQIDQVLAILRSEGMVATVSSIHVNGWFGDHSKLTAAHWMLQRLFGRRLSDEIDRWVYVGDSTNDQLMFSAFALSVGVANLRRFADRLQCWPTYITQGERGAGFAEVAARLLQARQCGAR